MNYLEASTTRPVLDRIDYRPDQRLARADLAQDVRRTATLLHLHTAREHDVWGVASGYLCGYDAEQDRVVVGTGVAVDARGRQLINPAQRLVAPPPDPDGAQLVVFWVEAGPAGCGPRGFPAERAGLRWVAAGRSIRPGIDIPIARLSTAEGILVDTASRPVAHPLTRPKIAAGRVLQATAKTWGTFANWTMFVSTATAGFVSSSPVYLAALDAHPFGDTADLGLGLGDAGDGGPPDLATRLHAWHGPFVTIESKDNTGFWLRVATATGPGWARDTSPSTNPVPVSWVGVETPDPGPFSGLFAFLLAFSTSAVITHG